MEVSQLAKEVPDQDYLRLLITYFACFELSSKDKATMLKSLSDEKHRTIVKNLEYLAEYLICDSQGKFKRRTKEHTKEQDTEYRRAESASKFNILRSEPLVCTLLKQMHNLKTDQEKFPYVEQPKLMKDKKATEKQKT